MKPIEELLPHFTIYDFEKCGKISISHAKLGVEKSGLILTQDIRATIMKLTERTWEDDEVVDVKKFVAAIAKDPPGMIRQGGVVLPRLHPDRSMQSFNANEVLPPTPKKTSASIPGSRKSSAT